MVYTDWGECGVFVLSNHDHGHIVTKTGENVVYLCWSQTVSSVVRTATENVVECICATKTG